MKTKNHPKPTVLPNTVEVSFAKAEVMVRISFQGPSTSPWNNITQVQNTPVNIIRDELKPQSEMLDPSSVMTSPNQTLKYPLLSSHKL
jgi:hypothetical protein